MYLDRKRYIYIYMYSENNARCTCHVCFPVRLPAELSFVHYPWASSLHLLHLFYILYITYIIYTNFIYVTYTTSHTSSAPSTQHLQMINVYISPTKLLQLSSAQEFLHRNSYTGVVTQIYTGVVAQELFHRLHRS